ncbi:Glutaredoxin-like protein [Cordyceps fumosorosea ARSEF 2679]|uniref:Glutaredoxin-like protein n=1 Tax=Cordyceps fumosorosea (strain ARSEF 2679) TaxID=1081104 RepID=A0A162MPA3_CORFA|nr:Glutaredoxin-like protein [Cordyceps fumosorosea ARSEF 2679]OAA64840.1 Glutaredoxin-like protein [Cordyceps fumosorosea ARSEF 2679]
MFATRSLFHACRITLFSRDNCGLCTQAKGVLSNVWDKRPFAYKEVNLALPESEAWRNLYDFDIPVIHIAKADAPDEQPGKADKVPKLMHRFTVEQVEEKMDLVGRN